jgi:hypothetical protein|tara:strand:- start:198 stop:398 length:201 start_codon:yes stop_codon:yes gene_type:complete
MANLLDNLENIERILNEYNDDEIGPTLNKKQRGIMALEARRRVELKLEEAQIRREIGGYDVDYDLD